MLLLITGVQVGIVRLTGLDHPPKDFQQALAQAAQGARVAFAFRAFLSVVNFGPRTNPEGALGPKMDGVAEHFVALVADVNPVNLAGLETDRRGAGDALQRFGILEALGMAAKVASPAQRSVQAGAQKKQSISIIAPTGGTGS